MRNLLILTGITLLFTAASTSAVAALPDDASPSREILDAAGITGGLVVHLGCGDGRLTAALRADDGFVVQGLDSDGARIHEARKYLQSKNLYGKVSVTRWSGRRLPYTDNLVNLVVAEDLGEVPMVEVMRVLAPGGVAYVKDKAAWKKTVKPRPDEIDHWSHFFHDATGNPVATDRRVGPPRHTQWEDGPRAGRSHENMSSVSAVLSAGGRVFSIMDEGPLASIHLPSRWFLTARDAFNGVTLWKKPIAIWQSRFFNLKNGPFQLPRRMVASDDRVYVTLGLYEPLSEIDAASGRVVRTFESTKHAEEVLLCDGKLVVVVNDDKQAIPYTVKSRTRAGHTIAVEAARSIVVIDTKSGRPIWTKQAGSVTPMTTVADAGRVFFHNDTGIRCLDLASGDMLWQAPMKRDYRLATNFSPSLLVKGKVVCYCDNRQLTAFAVSNGKRLWTVDCKVSTYRSPIAVCVINGVVWLPQSISWNKNTRDRTEGSLVGYELLTGKKVQEVPVDVEQGVGVCHHRCSMPKATDKYLITSWPGIEFTDTTTGKMRASHWVRGACLFGTMPANGLVYAPPNPCACYPEGKLNGFQVMAPARQPGTEAQEQKAGNRLERGPAFDASNSRPSALDARPNADWPTFRHDAERSGSTSISIPSELKRKWMVKVGGKLTQPIVAEGKLFVASIDTHTIHALDVASGRGLWKFTAGARIDSPPTYHRGTVIFGSRDGNVHCVKSDTGQLVWTFTASRTDRQVVSFGQLESPAPVSGSVLVHGNSVYFAAGKSAFLDDGIYLYRLNPVTGAKLSETRIYLLDSDGRQPQINWLSMPGALPDVLSSDGEYVYMRHLAFGLDGQPAGNPGNDHLYSPNGFLDHSGFHRSFWNYGKGTFKSRVGVGTGAGPGSKMIVMDKAKLFHFGRSRALGAMMRGEEQFVLSSTLRMSSDARVPSAKPRRRGDTKKKNGKKGDGAKGPAAGVWAGASPVQVRAMVLAGDKLFVAGPKGDWMRSLDAFEGRQGIALVAVSTSTGKTIADFPIPSLPVFDGMSAANESLYLSLQDGSIACLAGQ